MMDRKIRPTSSGDPLVEFIMSQSGLANALLLQHWDDGTGHCKVCSAGGQAGRYVWPCQTAVAAETAARHRLHGWPEKRKGA